jgi:transcriptional regulator GlxA family with amidase domain
MSFFLSRRAMLTVITALFGTGMLSSKEDVPNEKDAADKVNVEAPLSLAIVLYEHFEILDVAGPLQLLSMVSEKINTIILGPRPGPVVGRAGHAFVANYRYAEAPQVDIVLIPGSKYGTWAIVEDRKFLDWLASYAAGCRYVLSVCTGSAILAQAGLLEGYSATSNKQAFSRVKKLGHNVRWIKKARWVEDRDRWTSSGVSAGIDMSAAFLTRLYGPGLTDELIREAELMVQKNPDMDPFAAQHQSSIR